MKKQRQAAELWIEIKGIVPDSRTHRILQTHELWGETSDQQVRSPDSAQRDSDYQDTRRFIYHLDFNVAPSLTGLIGLAEEMK